MDKIFTYGESELYQKDIIIEYLYKWYYLHEKLFNHIKYRDFDDLNELDRLRKEFRKLHDEVGKLYG